MQYFLKCANLSPAFAFALIALPSLTPAQSAHDSSTSQAAERGHYIQTNLMADPTESVGKAPVHDPNLLNPWGLTRSPNGSPWWIGNNNSGTSTLVTGAGASHKRGSAGVIVANPPRAAVGGARESPGIEQVGVVHWRLTDGFSRVRHQVGLNIMSALRRLRR